MAHFAKLDGNNIVTTVVVVNNNVILVDGSESEQAGVNFLNDMYNESAVWKQTSYNKTFRTRFAQQGDTYDASLNAFIAPKKHASWVLNSTTKEYEPPLTKPTATDEETAAGKYYCWHESVYQADNTQGWVLGVIDDHVGKC